MKRLSLSLSLLFAAMLAFGQMVSLNPSTAGGDDGVTLVFNAAEGNGELMGASKVYMHHGVITSSPTGTDWQYVIGNWGQDDGVGEMQPVPGQPNKWQLALTPTVRAHFGVPAGENIFRISCVFRSADGSVKGTAAPGTYPWGTVTANQDNYVNLNVANYLTVTAPTSESSFVFPGQPVMMSATASSNVSSMKIWVDSGSGYQERASATSGTSISHAYFPSASANLNIKYTATINGENIEIIRQHAVTLVTPNVIEALPAGVHAGINYYPADATRATLVLQAPGKAFVNVVGDFSNWAVLPQYQMKKTPDGEYFWLTLTGLTPQQDYVFQYWVEGGAVKIGDPYADQVADPWNDPFIPAAVFPNVPDYPYPAYGVATVLKTGQAPFTWAASEGTWERPDINHLVIYELLVRDFLASHSYDELIDTLSYIKNLGVDAIEVMPFSEFEGNESWGYNPNYFFAVDKYYGTKEDLKRFIQAAHQAGLAVIMDMVMNHAYGTNPMVMLYFDRSANKPAANNPWFNREYVGPYQWGYDWNHESQYTRDFLDRLNTYWLEEFHVDGFRFDFTKGFTNSAPGGSIEGFDQSRINILQRMADVIWGVDPAAYIILEHWASAAEEQVLGNYGMKMWRNRSYDYVPATIGSNEGSFSGMDIQTHVSYFNSHDEPRLAERALEEGRSNGAYNVRNPLVMYERMKMAAAFAFLFPGPKMIWQFDELGYDIDINFNGRVGNKPLPWGPGSLMYYEDPLRRYIYDAYQGILDVRRQIGPDNMASATANHQLSGQVRRIVYNTAGIDMVLIGNFGLSEGSINPAFPQAGTWYDYFSGEAVTIANPTATINLEAGEWRLYTSQRLSDGLPGVVAIYDNPVTVTPTPFTQNDQITIRFDATKAFPNGTAGLVGAEKVYIHSGVVLDNPTGTTLSNVVGNLSDDGVGEMTEVAEDIWEITLVPSQYYGLGQDEEAFRIGMYFRDADNVNLGMGFRNAPVYVDVDSDLPFVTITPPDFRIDDPITITFNARKGNRELVGADKVYLHSSVDLANTTTPWNTAWNNVVGNWGMDDGVGLMTEVAEDIWEINLTPRQYYGLSTGNVVYWVAAVFRNANGSTKGTGTPGPIENGIIHTNQDFFLRNLIVVDTDDTASGAAANLSLFPNPTDGLAQLQLSGIQGGYQLQVLDAMGRLLFLQDKSVWDANTQVSHTIDLERLPAGTYYIRLLHGQQVQTQRLIKQ